MRKSLKAAAVIAGSLIAAGAGSPAFALGAATDVVSTNLNGVNMSVPGGTLQSEVLDTENKNSVLHKVNGATDELNNPKVLRLSGVSVQR
jgi:hypothetical protein